MITHKFLSSITQKVHENNIMLLLLTCIHHLFLHFLVKIKRTITIIDGEGMMMATA